MMVTPKEIKDLRKIFEPYLEGCHLKENAPKDATEAFEKYVKWHKEVDTDQ